MGLFSKKQNGILGIDLGGSAIKMVELISRDGRLHLSTYGFADVPSEVGSTLRSKPKDAAAVIETLLERSKTTSRRVVGSLPTFSVFTSIMHLPILAKKELKDAIRHETAKLIQQPIDDMLVNWEVLPQLPPGMRRSSSSKHQANDVLGRQVIPGQQGAATGMHVLVTAAEKAMVSEYTAIYRAANLELVSLETEAFALARSLVGHDQATVMVIDMGATNTDIMMIDGGVPVLNRSLAFGGQHCTAVFATSLGLPNDLAEQVKRDSGRVQRAVDASGSNAQAIVQDAAPVLQKTLAPLLNEIQYVIGLYPPPESGRKIEKIILTGGTSWLSDIGPHLMKRFNTTVVVGDPWARVETKEELKPVLDELGPRLSIAIGLAMRSGI
jgi:type IV pilus assembly protein PilM